MEILIFNEITFRRDKNYNLRSNPEFALQNLRSIFHGSETISCLGREIWNIVPLELKE